MLNEVRAVLGIVPPTRAGVRLHATPILHASAAAVTPGHRRVLQVDYAVADLPGGLRGLGV